MLEIEKKDGLLDAIKNLEKGQKNDFWSFKGESKRLGAHALIHYPAMMVPTLQGKLLDALKSVNPGLNHVLDPFVGSGTILVESMTRGWSFTGVDINPLAILACQVKSGPYLVEEFEAKANELISKIVNDQKLEHCVNFHGREKWFTDAVSLALSKIARAIRQEHEVWARRLFWLALAKVVRTSCNSRMSTYKLHAKKVIPETPVNVVSLYGDVLKKFLLHIRYQHQQWSGSQVLSNGSYIGGTIDVRLGDTRSMLEDNSFLEKFDMVMTSPPYGDNRTTIPYGQYSYLPMQWIDKNDISEDIALSLLGNTHAIDTASLGGSKKEAIMRGEVLAERYITAKNFIGDMSHSSSEFKRFAAFFYDLDNCLDKICSSTKTNGYQAWTIGNRHLGGRRVPMEDILSEMLAARSAHTIARIRRNIHDKKMPYRNSIAPTMSTETVLIAKKTA